MAEADKSEPAAKRGDEPAAKRGDEPKSSAGAGRKYGRAHLIKNAGKLIGKPGYVVAGALAQKGGTADLSVAETKQAVERFLTTEVKEA